MRYGTHIYTRGIRNNNPANIKYSVHQTWQGQKPLSECQEKTFCTFYHLDFGIRAAIILLCNYILKGYATPEAIIRRFAPASENHTENYIHFVCNAMYDNVLDKEFKPDEYVQRFSYPFYRLLAAILLYESNYTLTYNHYQSIIKHFKLHL